MYPMMIGLLAAEATPVPTTVKVADASKETKPSPMPSRRSLFTIATPLVT